MSEVPKTNTETADNPKNGSERKIWYQRWYEGLTKTTIGNIVLPTRQKLCGLLIGAAFIPGIGGGIGYVAADKIVPFVSGDSSKVDAPKHDIHH